MTTTHFLSALQAAVADMRATAQSTFAPLSLAELNQQPAPGQWSILECVEHLNRYSRYYNAAFAAALAQPSSPSRPDAAVTYSWLGRKSVALAQPTNLKKQATLKYLNPTGSRLSLATITEFDQHQADLLALLARAHAADLNRKVVPVEFFRLLKLRLGEALEFVTLHQQRHLQQASRVLTSLHANAASPLTARAT